MKTVGIIGGSGFIGSYVTKKFLEEGFQVKVSSTRIDDRTKYEHLLDLPNSANLEILPLDVADHHSLEKFIQDCSILIHGGTPFKLEVEDAQRDMFDPTVKGTQDFLELIANSDQLEKVVFIASVAALNAAFPLPAEDKEPDHIYTEDDAPFVKKEHLPYTQAKYYADQAVRKFIKENSGVNFEIASVYPTLVIGNPLSKTRKSESVDSQILFKKNEAPSPMIQMLFDMDVEFAMVSVRDVAEAIYKTAIQKGNHGERYLLSSEGFKISDIHRIMNHQTPKNAPAKRYSGKKAETELNFKYEPVKRTLEQFSIPSTV